MHERRLQWYGRVIKRDATYVGKGVIMLEVEGTRSRGMPKRRWMDSVNEDLREKGVVGDEFEDREEWRSLARSAIPV